MRISPNECQIPNHRSRKLIKHQTQYLGISNLNSRNSKIKKKKKHLKAEKSKTLSLKGKQFEWRWFLIRNHRCQKDVAQFFKLKERNYQTRNLHSAKISFRNEDIKILLEDRKLRNILANKYTIKEWLAD